AGVIGIYDVTAGLLRIGEIPSHGIGPHDILLTPDGETLVVANGGIETHPDAGRAKLNVADMQPSLVFIDRLTGRVKARHQLPRSNHKLSIRHLDIASDGTVWFGGQWEGSLDVAPCLIGHAGIEAPLTLIGGAVAEMGPALKGYIGSVAMAQKENLLAVSAPRAGRILYIDTNRKDVVAETSLTDGCGVAPVHNGQFAATSGNGAFLINAPANKSHTTQHPSIAFDNHMISATIQSR
ncbi:MAG: DUF1513 domain-containing protein, partial [Pseudomonadota bacterium]